MGPVLPQHLNHGGQDVVMQVRVAVLEGLRLRDDACEAGAGSNCGESICTEVCRVSSPGVGGRYSPLARPQPPTPKKGSIDNPPKSYGD